MRDFASADNSLIRPGKIYRGATPATLTPNLLSDAVNDDTAEFMRSVTQFIDLRSRDERVSDDVQAVKNLRADFESVESHVPLLGKRKVLWGLLNFLSLPEAAALAGAVASDPTSARALVTKRIDEGGLELLNKILVKAGKSGIRECIQVMASAFASPSSSDSNRVYVYCSAGKDRTGLVAAIILKLCGVDDNKVVNDYCKSAQSWHIDDEHDDEIHRGKLNSKLMIDYNKRLEDAGLVARNWTGAPPTVMVQTLAHITATYGSVEDYVLHCGVLPEEIDIIRQALVLPSTSRQQTSSNSSFSSSSSNFG